MAEPPSTEGNVLAFPQAPDAIELRHLRAFVAVAEELSFSRAADRLHISQSALSRQVSSLEKLLGCDLLRRSTHRVELTLAGEALLERTHALLEGVDEAVATTQSVGGELAFRLAQYWAPVFASAEPGIPLADRRAAIEGLFAQFPPPQGTEVEPVNAGGVPAFKIGPDLSQPATVLYLHGGGHTFSSAYGHRGVIGALTAAANQTALGPEYRLAPEHPFPADLEDVERAYGWMVSSGVDPSRIVLTGDSAGAGLGMSLLLKLKRDGGPMPGGAVWFCPWVDITGSTLRIASRTNELAEEMAGLVLPLIDGYLGGHPMDDPLLNPLEQDLSGLPPMLIQGATGDPQREDAHQLTERARAHGVDARLELYPVETHSFQIFWSFLPEAREAIQQAGAFIGSTAAGRGYSAAGAG
jgi:epsilon-lactone hydrolase